MADESADQSPDVRRALWLSIWDGIFANLYANLTGGVFLVGYSPRAQCVAGGAGDSQRARVHHHYGVQPGVPFLAAGEAAVGREGFVASGRITLDCT